MKQQNLIDKPAKRMKQPRKDAIRWRAELAEAQRAFLAAPIWVRLFPRLTARLRSSK